MGLAYERTIRSAVECRGVGLHSGAEVRLRILPAPAGAGRMRSFTGAPECRPTPLVSAAERIVCS